MTKSRLETFSDGVIAIVITLLVLEIHVPEVGEGESLADALWDQWPSYAAYLVSFITIGVMWLNHHRMFNQVVAVDGVLLLLNLYLLLWMAIIPFPTSLVAQYLDEGGRNASTALAVYGGVILMNAIAFTLLFGWITRDDRLLGQPIPAAMRSAARRRFGLGLAVYSVAFALSWVSAPLALTLHAAMALYYAFDQASVMTGEPVPSSLGG